jgi:hypothetical protein
VRLLFVRFNRLESGFDDLAENGMISDGQIGEDLAINLDIGHAEGMHQTAIIQAMNASSGIDADNPQSAHIPLAIATISIGESHRAHHGFMSAAEEAMACSIKGFRLL